MQMGILSTLILLPLLGALLLFAGVRENDALSAQRSKWIALATTLLTFFTSLTLLSGFNSKNAGFQFVEKYTWLQDLQMQYYLGIDGISILMVLLTTFLLPLCLLSSWNAVEHRVRGFMIAFLVLESFVIGVFCALDSILFYLFFEGMLIPMYLIIGIWGGANRVYAAYKFFLYTLLGSVLFLIAIIYLYLQFNTMEIPVLMEKAPTLSLDVQKWLWFAMFASFAVKVPMWPVHTWLPDAHVQAPTGGSVILAGVLLKMGAYGFLRFSMPMLPEATHAFAPFVFTLSIVAVIYTSLIALVQEDMKKLIAYSSVAHMGFVTAGLFSFNAQGIEGAIVQMVSHGLVASALFMCVGVVYDRMHTRDIQRYGGLVSRMPRYAFMFMLFTMASVGLPGTSGFVGEFLVILGVFKSSPTVSLLIASGMVLGAAYALWLYRRVTFGEMVNDDLKDILDLDRREIIMFVPVAVLVLWFGIQPQGMFDMMESSVQHLLTQIVPQAAAVVK